MFLPLNKNSLDYIYEVNFLKIPELWVVKTLKKFGFWAFSLFILKIQRWILETDIYGVIGDIKLGYGRGNYFGFRREEMQVFPIER